MLLCFNQKLGMQISRTGSLNDYSVPNPRPVGYDRILDRSQKRLTAFLPRPCHVLRECYRLTHPGSWKRNNEPIREMVRGVIRRHRSTVGVWGAVEQKTGLRRSPAYSSSGASPLLKGRSCPCATASGSAKA